jgi:polysaccharide biosynthesis/export protein
MKQIVRTSLVLLYLVSLVLPASAQEPGRDPAYRIGPRDLLEIKVFETEQLNVSRRVAEDGTINLPLVGDVEVAGMTETEAARKIKEVLEVKLLNRASVTVQVLEYRSRPISVIGAVRQAGSLSLAGRWTLLEAITAAGGLSEANGGVIYVLRRSDNGLSDQVAIPVHDLMVRADPRVNIPIYAGDLINVPIAVEVMVYCMGEIQEPGAVSFKSSERITLLTAIARAGGLTDRAGRKIVIKRSARGAAASELTVDYKRILAGKDPDVELQQGDVIVVKESFF